MAPVYTGPTMFQKGHKIYSYYFHLYRDPIMERILRHGVCSVMSNSLGPPGPVARLSMEFSRQEYWSGLPFPIPGESSQPRDQTCISCYSCIGRRILYHGAIWEAEERLLCVHQIPFPFFWNYMSQHPLLSGQVT